MLLRSALLLAVTSSVSAAYTVTTDDAFCPALLMGVSCGHFTTESACPTECKWDGSCGVTDAHLSIYNAVYGDITKEGGTLFALYTACQKIASKTDCNADANCGWTGDACEVNSDVAYATFEAAGAPLSVLGYSTIFHSDQVCLSDLSEADCDALDNCAYDTELKKCYNSDAFDIAVYATACPSVDFTPAVQAINPDLVLLDAFAASDGVNLNPSIKGITCTDLLEYEVSTDTHPYFTTEYAATALCRAVDGVCPDDCLEHLEAIDEFCTDKTFELSSISNNYITQTYEWNANKTQVLLELQRQKNWYGDNGACNKVIHDFQMKHITSCEGAIANAMTDVYYGYFCDEMTSDTVCAPECQESIDKLESVCNPSTGTLQSHSYDYDYDYDNTKLYSEEDMMNLAMSGPKSCKYFTTAPSISSYSQFNWTTDEASCEARQVQFECDLHEDEATCAADSSCDVITEEEWIEQSDGSWQPENVTSCEPVEKYQDVMEQDEDTAGPVIRLALFDCMLYTDGSVVPKEDCTGLCSWDDYGRCAPTDMTYYSLLVESGANDGTKGWLQAYLHDQLCSKATSQETCEVNKFCEYSDGYCSVNDYARGALLKNKCQDKVDFSELLAANDLTLSQVYNLSGIPDESSPEKLQEKREETRAAADAALKDADEKKKTLINGITNEDDKKKAEVLAAAAMKGGKVEKVAATVESTSKDLACGKALTGMNLASAADTAATCVATDARRRLLANYDVVVYINTAEVNATAAVAAFKKAEPTATVTTTTVDPVVELAAIPGVDATALADFKASAATSAALENEASNYETDSKKANVDAGLPEDGSSGSAMVFSASAIVSAALAGAVCLFA